MEKNEKNEKSKKSSWVYVLSVVYVIVAYTFFFISGYINQLDLPDNLVSAKNTFAWFFLFLPIILCVANYIIMFTIGKKVDRKTLLNCAVLVKYGLIPFYILGAVLILMFLLFSFTPVPFMIFVGPYMVFVLNVIGWVILIGSAPFPIAYIMKSCKEGIHGKALSIITGILQFFFVFDVISIMILAVKEKRWKKLTFTILALLLTLLFACIIGFITLIFVTIF